MSYDKQSAVDLVRLANSSLSSGLTSEVVEGFYQALDCPRSLTAWLLFSNGEFDQLVGLECDPSHYNSSESFRDAYLASCFLTKSKFLKTSFDRKASALAKFVSFEQSCAEVNSRFRAPAMANEFTVAGALLLQMRRKIAGILGDFDPEELFELSSWGPGVSTRIKGEETFAAKKFQYETGVTRDLHPLVVRTFPHAYPAWWAVLESNKDFPSCEVGNAIITVPKTSKIDRVIAIEPGINLWFQLGLGRMIRRRLGRVGIDLTDQGRNQRASKVASISGHLTTVDFSSASDSIARELVRNLFGHETGNASLATGSARWFEVMDLVRSKYGTIDGKVFEWNKFSSMGNGFTFDLETLIFYTAAVAVCERLGVGTSEVSVYGDDVIIPTVCYETFRSLCEYLGFSINAKKSFSSGSFRESCGAHYFKGVDCKPLFLEEELDLPVRVFNFANLLRIRAKLPYGCDARFRKLFYKLTSAVPKTIRFRVSAIVNSQSGDIEPLEGGFVSNLDEASPQRARFGVEGYRVKRLNWQPVKVEVDYLGLLLAKVSSIPVKSTGSHKIGNLQPLRGRTKCRLTTTLVRQWCDLGPWI